ncbi:MAG: efflux RND transporter permease subunit, partial [Desulfobacterales bacterium]
VLAAQFESFVHPFVIMLTVPLAVVGALIGLTLTGQTLNIYSQIGMVMPEDMVDILIDFRSEKTESPFIHDLSDPAWYKRVPGFSSAQIDPELVTTSSDLFRIISTAQLNDTHLTITAIVHRQKEPETGKLWCKVLSWQIK